MDSNTFWVSLGSNRAHLEVQRPVADPQTPGTADTRIRRDSSMRFLRDGPAVDPSRHARDSENCLKRP